MWRSSLLREHTAVTCILCTAIPRRGGLPSRGHHCELNEFNCFRSLSFPPWNKSANKDSSRDVSLHTLCSTLRLKKALNLRLNLCVTRRALLMEYFLIGKKFTSLIWLCETRWRDAIMALCVRLEHAVGVQRHYSKSVPTFRIASFASFHLLYLSHCLLDALWRF